MTKTTKISFSDRPEYISKFLTHWTGRGKSKDGAFEMLKKIIETKELKFSPNRVSFPDNIKTVTNLMICFTDTPIKHSKEHCNKYGFFGISFNKDKLIHYGANPVLYLMDNRKSYHSYLLDFTDEISIYTDNQEKLLLNWFSSIMQPYNTNPDDNKHFPEFFEREWRIAGRVLPFHWLETLEKYQGKHNEYEFAGRIRRQQNSENINDNTFFLQFDTDIIENIVVPESFLNQTRQLFTEQKLNCELIIIE